MFERDHHQRIAHLLEGLDARFLEESACLFGGGTAIVLKHGEYRESLDVDFLVSQVAGYRAIRERLTTSKGVAPILRSKTITQRREVRADQYGIRTVLEVDNIPIKFEIVFEARIALEPPSAEDHICGVATLTALDMLTSKLLANADRWADENVFSRDLIDLAMMQPPKRLLNDAVAKASAGAYGASIERSLTSAIALLRTRVGRVDACMEALHINVPKAVLWKNIRRLEPKSPKAKRATKPRRR